MKLLYTWINRALSKMPFLKSTRLTWQAQLTDLIFRKKIADLKASDDKEREKLQRLEFDHLFEISMLYEELDAHQTNQLIKQARQLCVHVPPKFDKELNLSECWEQGNELRLWNLTDKGILEVRQAIRNELEWVYKRREHYTTWINGMIGIIGAILGVIIGSMLK